MKKEISKSNSNKGVKNIKSNSLRTNKIKNSEVKNNHKMILKIRKGMTLNIVISLIIVLLIILFVFIVKSTINYFNTKIDEKNKLIVENYIKENKKVCFGDECFYIIDYSIKDRTVSLITEKNISLDEVSIQKDFSLDIIERKNIGKYLECYKKTIENLGIDVIDISIPHNKQLEKNGCNFHKNTSNVYTCSDEHSWIYNTSYYYEGEISGVMVNIRDLEAHFIFPFDMTISELENMYGKNNYLNVGIRPVIKILIKEID